MTESFTGKIDSRRLARAYVALAFAQQVAKGCINERLGYAGLHPLLTALDITAKLLEELLQDALPEEDPAGSSSCAELLM